MYAWCYVYTCNNFDVTNVWLSRYTSQWQQKTPNEVEVDEGCVSEGDTPAGSAWMMGNNWADVGKHILFVKHLFLWVKDPFLSLKNAFLLIKTYSCWSRNLQFLVPQISWKMFMCGPKCKKKSQRISGQVGCHTRTNTPGSICEALSGKFADFKMPPVGYGLPLPRRHQNKSSGADEATSIDVCDPSFLHIPSGWEHPLSTVLKPWTVPTTWPS